MSFGFGVGDFIAVGELSWKLYRNVYQVSRDAPPEIQSLHQELSHLSNVIKALEEDALDQDSAIAKAPNERVKLGRDLLRSTEENLRGLEVIANKYLLLEASRTGSRSRKEALQKVWKRIQFAGDVRQISDYRAKVGVPFLNIHYNTGLLSLLLQAARNSSLERIQDSTEKLTSTLDAIKSIYIPAQNKSPSLTCSYDEQSQFELTRKLMAKAEVNGLNWAAVGIENWIQVGKWWLMKAQAGLDSDIEDKTQAYADLLKASWILTDIIGTHPQLSFFNMGQQQIAVEHISRVAMLEHKRLDARGFVRPPLSRVISSNLVIWDAWLSTQFLPPMRNAAAGRDPAIWKSDSGTILHQRFGYYGLSPVQECVIFLLDTGESLKLIAQSAHGNDLVIIDPCWRSDGDVAPENLSVEGGDVTAWFRFLDRKDARLFHLLIKGINKFRHYACYWWEITRETKLTPRALKAVALFETLNLSGNFLRDLPEQEVIERDIRLFQDIEEDCDATSLYRTDPWKLAMSYFRRPPGPPSGVYFEYFPAKLLMQVPTTVSWILWADSPVSDRLAVLDALVPSWAGNRYCLIEALSAAIVTENPQLLWEVVRRTGGAAEPATGNREITSILSMVHEYLGHICSTCGLRGTHCLLWLSFKARDSSLLAATMDLHGHYLAHDTLEYVCERLCDAKDIVEASYVCEMFVTHILTHKSCMRDPEKGCEERVIDLWERFGHLHWFRQFDRIDWNLDNKERGKILVESAIRGDISSVKLLQEQTFYLNVNADPSWRSRYEMGELKGDLHPYSHDTLEVDWPYWPLHIAIRLAHPIELSAHLIASDGLLWHKDFEQEGEPSVLRLIRSCDTLQDGRNEYYQFHATLRDTIRRIAVAYQSEDYPSAEPERFVIFGEIMDSQREVRELDQPDTPGCTADPAGSDEYGPPKLPEALETDSNFFAWKQGMIALLEEATAAQLGSDTVAR